MRDKRLQVRLDEDTLLALRRLADSEERSMAGQIRAMVRREAAAKGLWTPRAPQLVAGKAAPRR